MQVVLRKLQLVVL